MFERNGTFHSLTPSDRSQTWGLSVPDIYSLTHVLAPTVYPVEVHTSVGRGQCVGGKFHKQGLLLLLGPNILDISPEYSRHGAGFFEAIYRTSPGDQKACKDHRFT